MKNEEKILKFLQQMQEDISELKSGQQQMQEDISKLKNNQTTIQNDISDLKSNQQLMQSDIKELNRKTNSIFEQTAGLLEYKTGSTAKVLRISKTVRKHGTDIQLLKKAIIK